ncbi:MAG TPA: hypothetical protein VFU07_05505 [Candidatus Lumbricidophila sp.]|nr:hypothetical protein [Candidatus Lumbricidophila sp.]
MATAGTPVTAQNALFTFYDIESLTDAFTVASFTPRTNRVELFYLLEQGSPADQELTALDARTLHARITQSVIAANPAFKDQPGLPRQVALHDLGTLAGIEQLALMIGLFEGDDVNNPESTDCWGGRFRPVCDTDPAYDPINKHAYLAGYNSYAYDTSMLALFFQECLANLRLPQNPIPFSRISPKSLRQHNNRLFSDEHRSFMPNYLTNGEAGMSHGQNLGWNSVPAMIRKAMLDSGRHIDVSRLNETQRMVGLKRLLGGMGRQILESDKLGGHNATLNNFEEFCELLAYNVSDVIGLAKLFEHPAYSSSFDLKKGLLDEYPETVYNAKKGTHTPNISQRSVRRGRLAPDSTSAKFVAKILAPYKDLTDIPAVSFLYPSEQIAKETGRERRNVLDDCIAFFEASVSKTTAAGKKAHHDFNLAMSYYKSIEGQNFNDEVEHVDRTLAQVPRTPNNLSYFNQDGTPSTCFVTFSTGGIHGAEYDEAAYAAASASIDAFNARMAEVREAFPDPLDFWMAHPGKAVFTAADGTEMTRAQVLTSGTSLKLLKAKREAEQELDDWLNTPGADAEVAALRTEALEEQFANVGYRPDKLRPELFEKLGSGATKLKSQFTYTSAARVIHEDFTSYYPNMLRNMSAFFNPDLGTDRYAKIFEDKERYGREMKRPGISSDEKTRLGVLRNGTKLILNSASGAGDTTHKNPIRMNNQIISMRIIGQLFSWRIGQAQTLAGARIVSTNTDGLYSVLDDETNNRVLAEQAALIGVDIEPEPLWLISKDSNNRLELEVPHEGEHLGNAKIISASGGTLACHKEPQPTKSLAHPAVIDWALARYLRAIVAGGKNPVTGEVLALDRPLDRDIALGLMEQARRQSDAVLAARLFQNVLAASAGKLTFPFATDLETGEISALQHYSRVFIMKPGNPGTVSIQAAGAWVVTEVSRRKRQEDGMQPVTNDPIARQILAANGWSRAGDGNTQAVPSDQDIAVRRVPRLDPEWSMRVDNRDLVELDPAAIRAEILAQLDLDAYVEMLATTFEENWMNQPRATQSATQMIESDETVSLPQAA